MTLAEMIYAVSHPIKVPQTVQQKAMYKFRKCYSYDEAREYYRKAHEIRHDDMMDCLDITSGTAKRMLNWSEMAGLIEYVRTDGAVKVYRRKL